MPFVFLLFFSILIAFTSAAPGWRDAPEFILSAFFLDIAHPTGAPLYSQLSNAAALLPIGPIAFRVNAFSSACGAAVIVFSYLIVLNLQKSHSFSRHLLALIPGIVLLHVPSFIKGALTAEVYLLHTALILLLLYFWQRFLLYRDCRYLLLMAFIAGLSLGNHVSALIIFGPVFAVIIISNSKKVGAVFLPALVFAALGLAIYAYLPLRAGNALSLNTGNPQSVKSFIDHITDKRDRVIRPAGVAAPSPLLTDTIQQDFRTLVSELPLWIVVAGSIGLILLFASNFSLTTVLSIAALGNWYFFKGWDPDPWGTLISILAIGFAIAVASFHSIIPKFIAVAPLLLLGVLQFLSPQLALALFIRESELSSDTTKQTLSVAAPHAPFVAESTWFLTKYMRDIEGYRPDIAIIYGPSLFAPQFFPPPELQLPNGERFALTFGDNNPAKLFDALSRYSPIYVEPQPGLNQFISGVAQPKELGAAVLVRHEPAGISAEDASIIKRQVALRRTLSLLAPRLLANDAFFQLQVETVSMSSLLRIMNRPQEARSILSALCEPLASSPCGEPALNGIALSLIDSGEAEQAVRFLEELIAKGSAHEAALRANLALAKSKFSTD